MSIRFRIAGAALVALWLNGAAISEGAPLEFPVKTGHMRHASSGTLVFGETGVDYRTSKKDAGRRWAYEQIKQIQVLSPTKVAIRTYEDQSWLHLWADRTVEFEIEKGQFTPELSAFLLRAIPRPVLAAVLPPPTGTLRSSVPVKHVRGRRGSTGDLSLYDNALVYRTARPGESRYWRFGDIASVFAVDRFRLTVLTFEGGGGDTRPFEFQLQSDLPPGFYDRLWSAVNPPAALR